MRRAFAVSISAAVVSSLLSASAVLPAEGFGGKDGGRRFTVDSQPPMHGRIATAPPRRLPGAGQTPRPFPPGHGRSRHDGFGRPGHGFVASGPVGYYWPSYLADSGPAYVEPPAYAYAPAPAYIPTLSAPAPPPPPPAPPTPSVVEHPGGRYELRGDGVSTPYTWVWVPNPPPAPPPPPAAEPAPSAPARRSSLYTWTDRDGVVHWTDNANIVPEEYRAKVQKRSM